jgi:hypothetical protein
MTLDGKPAGFRVLETLQAHVEYMSAPVDPLDDAVRAIEDYEWSDEDLEAWMSSEFQLAKQLDQVPLPEDSSLQSTAAFWAEHTMTPMVRTPSVSKCE